MFPIYSPVIALGQKIISNDFPFFNPNSVILLDFNLQKIKHNSLKTKYPY